MPHIMIDYSPNLEDRLDIGGLCRTLCRVAGETGVFPVAGIRVRATACTHVAIADGDPGHGFLDISLRAAAGRPAEKRRAATDAVFEAARDYCAELQASMPFLLSLELREIDPDFSRKTSSIRDYLPEALH